MPDSQEVKRQAFQNTLHNVRFTPVEGQIAAIKELLKDPDEANTFLEDPKKFAVEHSLLLDPEVVKTVSNLALFDVAFDDDLQAALGEHITKDLVDIRDWADWSGTRIHPVDAKGNPIDSVANVMAVAAVVVAVAAVVTAVVTLVRTKKPEDLVALQGLGTNPVLLPHGIRFVDRTGLRELPALRQPGIM